MGSRAQENVPKSRRSVNNPELQIRNHPAFVGLIEMLKSDFISCELHTNDQRSHAGPVTPNTPQDGLPVLADTFWWTLVSFGLANDAALVVHDVISHNP